MSIINPEKTANHISNWIKDYAIKAGVKTLVFGLSGGIDSALVALLCKKTGMACLGVNMPCHSSESAYNRATALAHDYYIPLVKVDLSEAHNVVYNQVKDLNLANYDAARPIAVGGLRSCLRAPTLSYFANSTSGLIVGTGNRSEDHMMRYYQKYGDGCVDISPISDLFKGEVRELFAYLAAEMNNSIPESAQAILDAKPTADLWGPNSGQEDEIEMGLTYDEIEWADRENMKTIGQKGTGFPHLYAGIIFSNSDPAKHPAWQAYSGRQRVVIAKIHQAEKISRHKVNANLPCCLVRDVEGLVR